MLFQFHVEYNRCFCVHGWSFVRFLAQKHDENIKNGARTNCHARAIIPVAAAVLPRCPPRAC